MITKERIITIIIIITTVLLIPSRKLANTVEYRGESEGLIIAPNDFFMEFGELLPGDKKSDKVEIKNKTKEKIEVYFKTEAIERGEYYDDIDYSLLEKIGLKIKEKKEGEEETIYEGNLGAMSLGEYVSLGEYEGEEEGELEYEIEVPKELRNEYGIAETKVRWVFKVEKKEKGSDPEGNHSIKTGDYVYKFVVLIVVAWIIIIMSERKKKRKKNGK